MKNVAIMVLWAMTVVLTGRGRGGESVEDYPSGNVTVVVPYSAGGGSDSITRAIVDIAKGDFNNKIAVENRTGGAGAVGMLYGAHAKPDGYTLSMIAVEVAILPHMGLGGGLKPDLFKPVILFNADPSVLTVQASSPWRDLDALARAAQQEVISMGNSGVGSIWHFAGAAFGNSVGGKFNFIPFEGAAPAITALLGGHLDATSVSYGEVLPYVRSGDLRILASLSPERIEDGIPTAKELGYDVEVGTWRGFAVPKDTPDALVDKLYTIFSKAVATQAYKTFMENNGFSIKILGPEEFEQQISQDYQLFEELSALVVPG